MSNESRKARAQRQQSPGMASTGRVDPATGARARRAAAGEQAAGVRYKQGLRVQDDGSLEVHTDATLRVDQRQQLGVRNKFPTPTDGTQAANKDYVDTALGGIVIIGDSEYVVEYNRPPTGPSISTTTSWMPAPPSELYAHNNIVSPSNPAAVYATTTHTGTGDDCVYLYPGYVYGIALSLRCYQSAFELGLLFSPTISATAWNVASRSIRFTEVGDTSTVYLLLDNTDGTYTYVTPAFRRYSTGTAIVSTVRMHARRLHPHYEGGYPALPLPGPPDAPEAGFEAESATLLAFRDELFSNLSTGLVTSVAWDFGDQYTPGVALHGSAERNPVYRYEAGGTFPVSITATGDGGSDTHTANVTVQDVVCTENILNSVGILDAADFDDLQSNVASQSVSSIAAPDGTLTAIETVATSSTVSPVIQALLFETTGTYTQIGDLWQDGLAWTCAIYAYMGQANAARITLQARTMTTAGVQSDQVAVAVQGGSVASFTSSSTGAVSYSAERNACVEAVGDTGWYRIELTLQDYARTCDRIYLAIFGSSGSAYDRHITWNPTLRYGDWVARGKNWDSQPDLLSKTIFVNGGGGTTSVTREQSPVVAPDGTLSAVDVTPQGTITNWSYWIELHNPPASNGIPVPSDALVTVEFYLLHPIPFSAPSISYNPQVQVLLVTSGGALVERAYFHIDAAAGGGISTITNITSADPSFYTVANCVDVDPVGSDGWHRYRLRIKDTGGTAAACRAFLILGKQDGGDTTTIWNPRLTVGNPADWETVLPFVSGPQNLLGDGSDLSIFGQTNTTLTTNVAVAPNGRLEADQESFAGAGNDHFSIGPTGSITPLLNRDITISAYFKLDATAPGGNALVLDWRLYGSRGIVERVQIYLNMNTAAVNALVSVTTGGPGYTTADVDIDEISNGWFRLAMNFKDYSGAVTQYVLKNQNVAGSAWSLTAWGFEVTTIDPLDPV